jgi:hypothetical protein
MYLRCSRDDVTVELTLVSSVNELKRWPDGPNHVISALGYASTIHSVIISSLSTMANFLMVFKMNGASKCETK